MRHREIVHRRDQRRIKTERTPGMLHPFVEFSRLHPRNTEQVPRAGRERRPDGAQAEDLRCLIRQSSIKQERAERLSRHVVLAISRHRTARSGCRELCFKHPPRLVGIAIFATIEHERRETTPHPRVSLVQPQHDIEMDHGLGSTPHKLREIAEPEMRLRVIGLDLKHTPKLLPRIRKSVHLDQQRTKIEQRLDIARVTPQLSQKQLPRSLVTTRRGIRLRQTRLHTRHLGLEPCRLAETPDRSLVLPLIHQGLGHRRVQLRTVRCRLLAHEEHQLGLVEASHTCIRLDAMHERRGIRAIQIRRTLKPRQRLLDLTRPEQTGTSHHSKPHILRREIGRPPETHRRIRVAARRVQRQTQIEVPLRLVWIQREGTPQLSRGVFPTTGLVVLMRTLDVLLCLLPVAHGLQRADHHPHRHELRFTPKRESHRSKCTIKSWPRFPYRRMYRTDPTFTPSRPSRWHSPIRIAALLVLTSQPACAAINTHPHSDPPPSHSPHSNRPDGAGTGKPGQDRPDDPEDSASIAPHEDQVPLRDGLAESTYAATEYASQPQPAPVEPVRPEQSVTPAAQQDAARTDRAALIERLVLAMRRLFDATPPEQHGELLVGLLRDELPELRGLGLTLVDQELADAERIAPEVGFALIDLLNAPDGRVRAAAARLLNRLAQPGLENRIAEALELEMDASVVAELLSAASRYPTPRLVQPTLRWIGAESVARESASQAGLALDRAELLSAEDREVAASRLRARAANSLSAPGVRLLARVGTDADRRTLVPLLRSPEAAIRIATAEALSRHPPFVDDIVLAAIEDTALVDIAVRAIASHRASLEGLLLLRALTFATEDARLAAASQVTAGMDTRTLILAADESSRNAPFVEALLGSFANTPMPTDPVLAVLHARSLVRLAEAQLNLSRPGRALSLADRADPLESELPEPDQERLRRVRTVSLVWLDRLDDPGLAGSTPEHWLDALDLLGAQPQGPDISDEFLKRFGSGLSADQLARYMEIEARVLTGPRPLLRPAPSEESVPATSPASPSGDGPR